MVVKINKAFTLIELLVVISIIASLLAVGVPNFIGMRQRGRDSKRKVDLKEIQSALELYKLNQNPPSYPDSLPNPKTLWEDTSTGTVYMKLVPADPLSSSSNKKYYYKKSTSSGIEYDLYACLENQADTGFNIGDCPDDFASVTGYSCSSAKCYHLTQP